MEKPRYQPSRDRENVLLIERYRNLAKDAFAEDPSISIPDVASQISIILAIALQRGKLARLLALTLAEQAHEAFMEEKKC